MDCYKGSEGTHQGEESMMFHQDLLPPASDVKGDAGCGYLPVAGIIVCATIPAQILYGKTQVPMLVQQAR